VNTRPLTRTMVAELRHIGQHGTFRELDDYGFSALAFYARDKVHSALIARGLIADAETITDAGREALKATGSAA
jgi:hypothetical protein